MTSDRERDSERNRERADTPWAGLGSVPALDEVISAYIQAREAGMAAGREAWLARFPDLAGELEAFISTYEHMNALMPGAGTLDGLELPARIADYELLEELGHGGAGVVYRARDVRLHREVAFKLIRNGRLASAAERQRLENEARVIAHLSHPGIVPLYEMNEQDDYAYLVMALVRGGSLATHIERLRARPLAASVRLIQQVTEAIQHAHERAVLHRDIKPANILLAADANGWPRVTDFGLAMRLDDASRADEDGLIVGTASYMAPEQARGEAGECTVATDIYGLGTVLYELLTGRPPFLGDTLVDTLRQVEQTEPMDPRALDARVDADLAAICLRCLEKDPDHRYTSAADLAADLGHWLERSPVTARPLGPLPRAWRWLRRKPERAALVVAAAALAGILILLASLQLGGARERFGEARGRAAEIQASCEYAARHVAQTVRRRIDEISAPVGQAATRPGLAALLHANDWAGLERFVFQVGTAHSGLSSPYENWFVLDQDGHMLARWPVLPAAYAGADLSGRDYFVGAMRRAGAVHVSRPYESTVDHIYKLAVAAAVMDGERPIGVLAASVATGPTLQIPVLHDERHKAALVARMDTGDVEADTPALDDPTEHRIILHSAYPPRAKAVTMDAALASRVMGLQAGGMEGYRDPVARVSPAMAGAWIAGHAPVDETPFAIVVQHRYAGKAEARQALGQTRRTWLGVLLAMLAALGVAGKLYTTHRRKRARTAA